MTEAETLTKKDFVPANDVRWCPGCGDYAILAQMQKVAPKLGIKKEDFVFVSGIGCSSRFPYYMDTYGFHTIHGRAPTFATGLQCVNPNLSTWVVTGDGDGLSIGGNHLMHIIRRNLNVNILLFNNEIYGLTKGQYSPTSPLNHRSPSSPLGSVDHPINPLSLALSSGATFVARTLDKDLKHMDKVLCAAAEHQGTSFIEIYQNCVIFNDGAFDDFSAKDVRADHCLYLEDGQAMTFGKEQNKALGFDQLQPEVLSFENGQTPDHALIHQPGSESNTIAHALASLKHPEFPVPVGIFRQVERPTYEGQVYDQIQAAKAQKGEGDLQALLNGPEIDTWQVS